MTKSEHKRLIDAIDDLEKNPWEWEEAMSKLYALAGLEYRDLRKIKGTPVGLAEIIVIGKSPS